MKIVSWNCNGALRKKLGAVKTLGADVYIIQECEDPAHCKDAEYKEWAGNHLWVGTNKNRGLAVFAGAGIPLKRIDLDAGKLELFIPCLVANRITLLAVWTRQSNSPNFRYIGQLWKYLQQHREFLRQKESALIGDLNSNTQWDEWDRWWNHSDVVRELHELGLKSLYHYIRGEEQGKEKLHTFYMHRRIAKPYHIDYAFLSEALLKRSTIEIGQPKNWLEYSDHMPLIVSNG
jgi:exonuclease III